MADTMATTWAGNMVDQGGWVMPGGRGGMARAPSGRADRSGESASLAHAARGRLIRPGPER
jgi:hypothetical protein